MIIKSNLTDILKIAVSLRTLTLYTIPCVRSPDLQKA